MKKEMLIAGMIAALSASSSAMMPEKGEREKCYGVAKMGKNDCASKDGAHACAGQAKKDNDLNEWVFVPKGLCDKLAGGSNS